MQYDAATGLYFDNARYYDASTGRFVSQDPMGFAAGDANLYRYVGNGPTNAVDPTGMDSNPLSPSLPPYSGGGPQPISPTISTPYLESYVEKSNNKIQINGQMYKSAIEKELEERAINYAKNIARQQLRIRILQRELAARAAAALAATTAGRAIAEYALMFAGKLLIIVNPPNYSQDPRDHAT